jgi:hypothetical protein
MFRMQIDASSWRAAFFCKFFYNFYNKVKSILKLYFIKAGGTEGFQIEINLKYYLIVE